MRNRRDKPSSTYSSHVATNQQGIHPTLPSTSSVFMPCCYQPGGLHPTLNVRLPREEILRRGATQICTQYLSVRTLFRVTTAIIVCIWRGTFDFSRNGWRGMSVRGEVRHQPKPP